MSLTPFRVALEIAARNMARRVEVLSGYRSEKFNEILRKKGHEVATRSRHVLGEALDFRLPRLPAHATASQVRAIHRGGVGVYRDSGFVHVDVGPERRWRGR